MEQKLDNILEKYDTDKNGLISKDEMYKMILDFFKDSNVKIDIKKL